MNSNNKYEIGSRVLIFQTYGDEKPLKDENGEFIMGTIIGYTLSDDIDCHGPAWYEKIYTVQDDNGNLYTGTRRRITQVGEPFYFYSVEDYTRVVEYRTSEIRGAIRYLLQENSDHLTLLNQLNQMNDNYDKDNKMSM